MQIERDKRLVESLISSKKIDAFVRRYREVIFDIIDKQMKKIDSSATLTLAKKGQLMSNFIDNLLTNDAKLLQNYLHPKRLRANNTDTENRPSLDVWIHQQCVRFFSAKLIIDGIFSLNINVIKTFFFSKGRPGCREIFSGWIFTNKVFSGSYEEQEEFIDNTIQTFVNKLYDTMKMFFKEEAEIRDGIRKRHSKHKDYEYSALTSLKNYRFEGDFYSYFSEFVVAPYLRKEFFPSTPEIFSIDHIRDNGENEENGRPLEIASPNDSFQDYEYRDFLERIFCVMERTQKGREQVEVLKLVFHLATFESREIRKDKDIAEILNISPRMLTYKKEQALKTAREIAEALNLICY